MDAKVLLVCLLSACAHRTAEVKTSQMEVPATVLQQPSPGGPPVAKPEVQDGQDGDAAPPVAPVKLEVVTEAFSNFGGAHRKWKSIDQDQQLHSGDRLTFHIRAEEPAYIYVFFVDAARRVRPLYVSSGNEKLPAGTEMVIPPPPKQIELDQDIGEENLVVMARRDQPIAADELRLQLQDEVNKGLLASKEEDAQPQDERTPRQSRVRRSRQRVASAGKLLPPGFPTTMGFRITEGADVKVNEPIQLSLFRFRIMHVR